MASHPACDESGRGFNAAPAGSLGPEAFRRRATLESGPPDDLDGVGGVEARRDRAAAEDERVAVRQAAREAPPLEAGEHRDRQVVGPGRGEHRVVDAVRGCENSSATGGASLDGGGEASLANDTAVFTTFGERPTAPSILAQGTALIGAGVSFGQGLRCAGGALKRMYVHIASGGSITAPSGLDLPISLRSAALADPLSPGSKRYYFVYYRDPLVVGGCPASAGFNATDTLQLAWRP